MAEHIAHRLRSAQLGDEGVLHGIGGALHEAAQGHGHLLHHPVPGQEHGILGPERRFPESEPGEARVLGKDRQQGFRFPMTRGQHPKAIPELAMAHQIREILHLLGVGRGGAGPHGENPGIIQPQGPGLAGRVNRKALRLGRPHVAHQLLPAGLQEAEQFFRPIAAGEILGPKAFDIRGLNLPPAMAIERFRYYHGTAQGLDESHWRRRLPRAGTARQQPLGQGHAEGFLQFCGLDEGPPIREGRVRSLPITGPDEPQELAQHFLALLSAP